MSWQTALPLDDLAEGTPTQVRIGTVHVVLVRQGESVSALDPICPHKFAQLADGHVEQGCLVCPVHEAGFHLHDGTPRDGDEWAGQATTHPCRVVGGTVEVDL